MRSQWDCVLQNLGEWVGSFTGFSPEGVEIEDIPSVISLVSTGASIQLVLKRFYAVAGKAELESREVAMSFSSPDPGAVFFDTGAFSSGGISVRRGEKAIAEFCLVGVDRRCRLVQVYSAVTQRLDRITLIREQRQGTNAVERPHLATADLLGTWRGSKIESSIPGAGSSANVPTASKLVANVDGTYDWDDDIPIALTATHDKLLTFDREGQSYQMLLLPDAAYSICPTQIDHGHPFYVEMGWILAPDLRHRLVRRYESTGKCDTIDFIVETRSNFDYS